MGCGFREKILLELKLVEICVLKRKINRKKKKKYITDMKNHYREKER